MIKLYTMSFLSEQCLHAMCDLHTANTGVDQLYTRVATAINDDILEGRYRDGLFRPITDPEVIRVIDDFYTVVDSYYDKYHFSTCPDLSQYVVFRAVSNPCTGLSKGDRIPYHIPFVTRTSENGAKEDAKQLSGSLWKIGVPVDTRFLCIKGPGKEDDRVVLPSGYLVVDHVRPNHHGITVISAVFTPESMKWHL